jgi:hypothetical protein
MLEFKKTIPMGSDGTAGYDVELDKDYNVKTLLEEILNKKRDWGKISVKNGGSCEYRYRKLLSELSNNDLSKKVKKVTAVGGWSLLDYYIETF